MSARVFAEDEVVLKEDHSICAVVEQTWQDGDLSLVANSSFIPHRGITLSDYEQCLNSATLIKGLALIKFVHPPVGLAIVAEEDLVVRDRGLCVGDIVKRSGTSPENGCVVKTSLECDCRPMYPSLLHSGPERWPHKEEEKEIRVPSEDLELQGFVQGKFVIYNGWVGEVMDMIEEVTIRMSDGSVVRIGNLDDLEIYHLERPTNHTAVSPTMSLAESVRTLHSAWKEHPEPMNRQPPDLVYPGQLVYAKKSVFRLGSWIIGSYTPSVPAVGHVMEVHVTSIEVEWLAAGVNSPSNATPPRPESFIEGHELNDLVMYNRNNLTELTSTGRNFGARQSQDIVVGDPVAFRDVAGAAVKHAASGINKNRGSGFKRVPRSLTNGFNINTLQVIGTTQHVVVQWQSGAITQEKSTDLTPLLLHEEHDWFVGELCSLKSSEKVVEDCIRVDRVGVVQSMDARERTVKVRWYDNSRIEMLEGYTNDMLPQSTLGELQDEIEEISVYELSRYEALTKRRGDLVLIRSDEPPPELPPTLPYSPNDVKLFGEVVDLGMDGLVTVRLGALDRVQDIRVPATHAQTILGADDEGSLDDDESISLLDEDSFFGSEYSDDEMDIIEETITYEGEPPEDAGDDDAWMTDVSDEDNEVEDGQNGIRLPGSDDPRGISANGHVQATIKHRDADTGVQTVTGNSGHSSITQQSHSSSGDQPEYSFASFSNKPAQFEVLDTSPPSNHRFFNRPTTLTGPLLRRIRKEHKMLAALPPGIFVRTWNDALYLMRILIVGPRATPYELAPFVLDVHFRDDYPTTPPQVHFHSWTYGVGRVNPNLYEDGMVCLSILGTWQTDQRNEGWNKDQSSLLQVLVSLMGLVLVESPYYNEAGFEVLVGTEETAFASETYSQRAFCMSKGFVEWALQHGSTGLDDVIKWLYTDEQGPKLLSKVVAESRQVLEQSQKRKERDESTGKGDSGTTTSSSYAAKVRLTAGAQGLLRRHLEALEKRLATLS